MSDKALGRRLDWTDIKEEDLALFPSVNEGEMFRKGAMAGRALAPERKLFSSLGSYSWWPAAQGVTENWIVQNIFKTFFIIKTFKDIYFRYHKI